MKFMLWLKEAARLQTRSPPREATTSSGRPRSSGSWRPSNQRAAPAWAYAARNRKGGDDMAITTGTMTDEQRKSVALEYLKAFDKGGVTSTGDSIVELFADDAQVYFPKWGLANGKEEIGQLFGDVGETIHDITHDYASFNWIFSGTDTLAVEGTSFGEHRHGLWRAGEPEWSAGRGGDVFEIRDFKIQRCFIYLDPDYARVDTERYPWLQEQAPTTKVDGRS